MPRIFDNISSPLLKALQETIDISYRADFCVGYFNLRGWQKLVPHIERWAGGEGQCIRLLIGMQDRPEEELRQALSLTQNDFGMSNEVAEQLRIQSTREFHRQLTLGAPTNQDETALRDLVRQLKSRQVIVKLFLRQRLHAKLYLLYQFSPHDHSHPHPNNPIIGYLGSSNLTFAGLKRQMELNVDVVESDACSKLAQWFEDRWDDLLCVDISEELIKVIEESWVRERAPYHIYVKMAYHLSQEARSGLSEFTIPRDFQNLLFEFQSRAVRIAAGYLHRRGGVLIGDVVGLGKTLMASALVRIFRDDFGYRPLIICPKNLVPMWEQYNQRFDLGAEVLSLSRVQQDIGTLMVPYRLVLIDESHNLRNREGKIYRRIQEYIQSLDARVILLSATPYNKSYLDLSSQLRLFVPEERDLGIRPEHLLRTLDGGEAEFSSRHECNVRSLAAFEKSPLADDWRELMRLFLIRRTRTFIKERASFDAEKNRHYLQFPDGRLFYFPDRIPKQLKFKPGPQYAKLYADEVVDVINDLNLPRYGLNNYTAGRPTKLPSGDEQQILDNLSRARRRLMGFTRTNLFKRLESNGQAFVLSIERHILRNYVFLHAIEAGKSLPIGTQDAAILDARIQDEDRDSLSLVEDFSDGALALDDDDPSDEMHGRFTEQAFRQRAEEVYHLYETKYRKKFKWIRSDLFEPILEAHLREDVQALLGILQTSGEWNPASDAKLKRLCDLLVKEHPNEKVLVFTQFADTVQYLASELQALGIDSIAGATGKSADPTGLAWRFSPESNGKRRDIPDGKELRVLISTDVLSEGQNLQDCSIVVNFDLPWAIIRLIQRVGRVDRIGQKSPRILCYNFWPADGVERLIGLRERVRQRLRENQEVVGTDEAFFEDDVDNSAVANLYNGDAGVLEQEADTEVDLSSYAYQIWQDAITADPALKTLIENMQPVVHATRNHQPSDNQPEGVLLYLRTASDNDMLAWVDKEGRGVTESQFEILKAAACTPETPGFPHHDCHHELVRTGVSIINETERTSSRSLGPRRGAKFRAYNRLDAYLKRVEGTLFSWSNLALAVEHLSRYPLQQWASDTLNRQLHAGINDEQLAELVLSLYDQEKLSVIRDDDGGGEPQIICSMGLFAHSDQSQ